MDPRGMLASWCLARQASKEDMHTSAGGLQSDYARYACRGTQGIAHSIACDRSPVGNVHVCLFCSGYPDWIQEPGFSWHMHTPGHSGTAHEPTASLAAPTQSCPLVSPCAPMCCIHGILLCVQAHETPFHRRSTCIRNKVSCTTVD